MSPGVIIRVRTPEEARIAALKLVECLACEDWAMARRYSRALDVWLARQPSP